MYTLLFKEAAVVGVLNVVAGAAITQLIVYLTRSTLQSKTKEIDTSTQYLMLLSLFMTGAVIHLGCEVTGINKYYCKNGNACR